jgi:hypothetical protein
MFSCQTDISYRRAERRYIENAVLSADEEYCMPENLTIG